MKSLGKHDVVFMEFLDDEVVWTETHNRVVYQNENLEHFINWDNSMVQVFEENGNFSCHVFSPDPEKDTLKLWDFLKEG